MTLETLNLTRRLTYRGEQRKWTQDDLARLRYLWDELGLSANECAKLMGRTRNQVLSACSRYGMKKRGCPIPVKPDLVRARQIELARIAAIEELMAA